MLKSVASLVASMAEHLVEWTGETTVEKLVGLSVYWSVVSLVA